MAPAFLPVGVGTLVFEVEDEESASIDSDFELARYNTDGTLDTTFDTDGIATTHVPVTISGVETNLFSEV